MSFPDRNEAAYDAMTSTSTSTPQHKPTKFRISSLFDNIHDDCKAAGLELIGTAFFLLFGLGGIQAATAATVSQDRGSSAVEQVLYIATSMGLSLLVSAWLFFRITGGLFNPNVSLALLLVGSLPPVRFVLYCIAQLVGAIVASAILSGLTPAPLSFNTFLQEGTTPAQGVFIEMFITAALVVAVLMLAAEKHQTTPFAPVGIGLTLFACHLFAVYYTGAAMNTARAFGPAVITGFPYTKHWVYWVGPFLGSLLGAGFYACLKHYRYWTLNPDQATRDPQKSPSDPVEAFMGLSNGGDIRAPGAGSDLEKSDEKPTDVQIRTPVTSDSFHSAHSHQVERHVQEGSKQNDSPV